MSASIPPFEPTPVESIPAIVDRLRRTFFEHRTKPVQYRLTQLRKLYWGLHDYEETLLEALQADLGKPTFEALLAEVGWCQNDILFICNNIEKWTKDEKAPDMNFAHSMTSPKIRKEPLGVVLVIGAFNFPVQLALGPFIGAIAAGCTAVLKPSEGSPKTAAVLQQIVEDRLDSDAYAVVQGAVPETSKLLDQKWDKIFYTGSATVGTIVAKKAAETLTPVALELGGRNPAVVTKYADPKLAARRLLWGKTLNAGQVCLAENYILVDKEILPAFIAELKTAMDDFYPKGAKHSKDYGRIVNQRHFNRIKSMLDNTGGKILFGGAMDEDDRFIEPTVIQVDNINDSLMTDEIFGPLLPIYPVENLDEAIRVANQVHSTPLALYAFGTKAETDKVLRETRSGGASINDAYYHGTIPMLEFGGVGDSGQGSYRGRASFDCFSHRRGITTTPSWMESMLSMRYPPFTSSKIAQYKRLFAAKPNFDREGRVQSNPLRWVLSLGAGSTTGAAGRYVVLIIALIGLTRYLNARTEL